LTPVLKADNIWIYQTGKLQRKKKHLIQHIVHINVILWFCKPQRNEIKKAGKTWVLSLYITAVRVYSITTEGLFL